jgi:hypothetical protein
MSGDGQVAESIQQLYRLACNRYLADRQMPEYDFSLFTPKAGKQTSLF